MSPVIEKIEKEFKKLAPREQVEMLNRLESMVYTDTEDKAFIETLKRRVREIESGKVKGRDALEIMKEIKANYAI